MSVRPYVDTFQGYPCNYDWYTKLKGVRDTSRWNEYTVNFLQPPVVGIGFEVASQATTLMCRSKTVDNSTSVYTLTEISSNEEIDPRMVENKIPNCNFSFKDQSIDKTTPLSDINAKLEKYLNLFFSVTVGYATYGSQNLRDENGLANLYISQWNHDTVTFNYYKITDAKFDYDTSTFNIEGEVLAFNFMSDVSMFSNNTVRFPENYYQIGNNYTNGRYRNCISPFAMLNCNNEGQYKYYEDFCMSFRTDHLYNTDKKITIIGPGNVPNGGLPLRRTYGLSTWLQWKQAERSHGGGSDHNTDLVTYPNNVEPFSFRDTGGSIEPHSETMNVMPTQIGYTLSPLAYYLTKESSLNMYKEFSLYNDFWMLPVRKVGVMTLAPTVTDGTWQLVGGKIPESDVFYDPNAVVNSSVFIDSNSGIPYDNGHYFSVIKDKKYKITPSMLLANSVKRRELEFNTVEYVESTYIPIENLSQFGGLFNGDIRANSDIITVPFSGYRDKNNLAQPAPNKSYPRAYYTQLQPNTKLLRYDYPSDGMIPLQEGYFYDELGCYVSATKPVGSDPTDPAYYLLGRPRLVVGNDTICPAASVIVGHNLSILSAYCNPRCKFWALNYETVLGDKAPITFNIPKIEPISSYMSADDTSVTDLIPNVKTVSPNHVYTKSKGLAKRILDRVNGSNMNPLYILEWDMVDDPSLRVGTVVYIPLQNQYVKCFIYKQQRSFNGGSTLSCEAWALEETNIPVLNPNPIPSGAIYRVNPHGSIWPKGEWLEFSWEQGEGLADLVGQNVIFGVYYKPHVGDAFLLYENLYLSTDRYEAVFNVPDLEAKLGRKLDLTGDDGVYYVKAYYASFGLTGKADFFLTPQDWDNKQFSEVYVGEVEAQDTILPLMNNHWMRG